MIIANRTELEQFVEKNCFENSRERFYNALRRLFVLFAAALHKEKFATEDLYKDDTNKLNGALKGYATIIVATEEIDSTQRQFFYPLVFISLEKGLHVIEVSEDLMDSLFNSNGELKEAEAIECSKE